MPPSGSKPWDGAVDVYGHHEFRLRRFALKMRAPIDRFGQNGYRKERIFRFILTECGAAATNHGSPTVNNGLRIALFQPDIAGNTSGLNSRRRMPNS